MFCGRSTETQLPVADRNPSYGGTLAGIAAAEAASTPIISLHPDNFTEPVAAILPDDGIHRTHGSAHAVGVWLGQSVGDAHAATVSLNTTHRRPIDRTKLPQTRRSPPRRSTLSPR